MEEGYLKFRCIRTEQKPDLSKDLVDEINNFRTQLRELEMIGKIPNGPGFGNLSVRMRDETFLITGSDTGGLNLLEKQHLSLVTRIDIIKNTVWCLGEIDASSESMSHAVVYESNPEMNAVVHVHHRTLWEKYLDHLPTTPATLEYGTPELAEAIRKFILIGQTSIVFGGHQDGLLFCGKDLNETVYSIMNLYHSIV